MCTWVNSCTTFGRARLCGPVQRVKRFMAVTRTMKRICLLGMAMSFIRMVRTCVLLFLYCRGLGRVPIRPLFINFHVQLLPMCVLAYVFVCMYCYVWLFLWVYCSSVSIFASVRVCAGDVYDGPMKGTASDSSSASVCMHNHWFPLFLVILFRFSYYDLVITPCCFCAAITH